MSSFEVVILAAGKGSRMLSDKAKVLHQLAGKSMLAHQLDTLAKIDECERVHLVVGHGYDQVTAELAQRKDRNTITLVQQKEQLGTGHAAAQALSYCANDSLVLILAGDIPLISPDILHSLWQRASSNGFSLLQAELKQPFGYGRLVRDDQGKIRAIVEEKDADNQQKKIQQVYCGVLAARADLLHRWLDGIECDNAQSEYYLTDIVALAVADGIPPEAVQADSIFDYYGVNSHDQLAQLHRWWQQHQAQQLMSAGVAIADPNRFDLRGRLYHGRDITIDINTVCVGQVRLGDSVTIGAHCYLQDCTIGTGSVIEPFSHISNARIGHNCVIGPYARIRPGSQLKDQVHVGNFVELKKAHLESGVKVNHLSYIGDAEIDEATNIGAGTITCNYDGTNKHTTSIGKEVFVGSNTSLIAPVTIKDRATIAAGSVISNNVEANALAVARVKQRNLSNWRK